MAGAKTEQIHVIKSSRALNTAVDRLAKQEKSFARLLKEYGKPTPWWRDPGFSTIAFIVCEQLISLESARATWNRLEESAGQVTPQRIIDLGIHGVREAGTTMAKAQTIVTLAQEIHTGSLDLNALEEQSDKDALAALTAIRGIGPWTAEVYMLGALRRADLFPVADRALVIAAAEFGLTEKELKPKALAERAKAFAPYRSVAAWILWHSYLKKRNRAEPK